MKRLVKILGEPTVLTTDKVPALFYAFKKFKQKGFYKSTVHGSVKHTNNCIEQEHRHASRTIKGIEAIHALYKQRRSLQIGSAFSVYTNYRNY